MCLLSHGTYECGHSVDQIFECYNPSCPSVIEVGPLHPAFYISIDGEEWATMATRCRTCIYRQLQREDPVSFRSHPEYRRLQPQGQLAYAYATQVMALEFLDANQLHRTHQDNIAIAASFQAVRTEDLESEDPACPICLEPLGQGTGEESQQEEGVRLPCNHIVGRQCLIRCLDGGIVTCPYCRRRIYENPPLTQATEDMWEDINDSDYDGEMDDGHDGYESEGAWSTAVYFTQLRRRSA